MTVALTAESLCLFRGDRCLFKDLEFALQEREMLVVEGPNGSGKTSLLRGIAGLLDFETGEITWNGQAVRDNYQAFRADLAWFAHRVGFKGDLNLLENLNFESGLRPSVPSRLDEVLERLGLSAITGLPFRSLSAGQQRTNLDKDGQALVITVIEDHVRCGGLCIAASHQPLEIEGTTHRVTL